MSRSRAVRLSPRKFFHHLLALFPGGLLFTALICLLSAPAEAQTEDITQAPLPQAVRNALARPSGENVTGPGYTVLQEGPINPDLYRLGAGDELTVHYTGRTSLTTRLVVSPEGDVFVPDVGTVPVAGRTLNESKESIRAASRRILMNVRVDVSLTQLRTFKVSIGGEVRTPGVFAATAVTRVQELLRQAGGLTDSAAVRDVRLLLPDGGVRHVDLLPFLLQGRMESNPFVSDGQSVFVPRRSRLVSVHGAVLYPGTYDLPDSGTTVSAFLDLVGVQPNAAPERVQLVKPQGVSAKPGDDVILDAQQVFTNIGSSPLSHGDQVLVPIQGGVDRSDLVIVEGEVRYPGAYSIAGAPHTAAEAITQAGGFTMEAVPSRVRLVRPVQNAVSDASGLTDFPSIELTATEKAALRMKGVGNYRAVIVDLSKSADLSGASGSSGGPNGSDGSRGEFTRGPVLVPGDRIIVPRGGSARGGSFVEVAGRVKHPGFYPHEPGATASDYVKQAGGYASRADSRNIRIAAGPGDNLLLARDAGPPEPGDRVWVPERTPRSFWDTTKDVLLVMGQVATIFIVIDQASRP